MAGSFKITIKRAFQEKSVRVGFVAKPYAHNPSATVTADGDIPADEARAIAAALIAEADRADSVAEKKAESEERRKKWRDREKAAGRIVEMSFADVFAQR